MGADVILASPLGWLTSGIVCLLVAGLGWFAYKKKGPSRSCDPERPGSLGRDQ
jgi:hypothetical protein